MSCCCWSIVYLLIPLFCWAWGAAFGPSFVILVTQHLVYIVLSGFAIILLGNIEPDALF